MAQRGQREPSQKVPIEWASEVIALADQAGLSIPKLAELAKIDYLRVYRLSKGGGSVKTARKVVDALASKGIKTPPLVMSPAGQPPSELAQLVERLKEVDPETYERLTEDVRRHLEAKEIAARGIKLISHPLRTDDETEDGD